MTEITAFGELLVDLIGQERGQLHEIETLEKRPGGAPANFAVAASKLGRDVRLVATVGDDSFGDFLIETIEDHGVATDHINRADHRTTLAFASLDEDAKPDFMFYRDAHADIHIQEHHIDLEQVGATALFHFGSLSLTHDPVRSTLFHVLDSLEDTRVSCDPNLRDDLWDTELEQDLRDALDHVDHLLLAEDELQKLFDGDSNRERALDAIGRHGLEEVAVTKGEDGSELHTQENQYTHEAFDAEAVDTTGAGDAFAAGYLTARLEGKGPERSLRQGNAVAAQCVRRHGAMAALPSREELAEVLQE